MFVSVIINNYNYGRWISEAIDSALAQDYRDMEIIVVDDGSTDDSSEVIRSYGDKIKTVFQENGGQGAAYNTGFAASRGDIILFLDSDDRLQRTALSEVVRHFNTGVSKVQFDLNIIDEQGRPIGRPVLLVQPDTKTFLPLLREFLFYPSPPGSGNAYSRDCVAKRLPIPAERWKINADTCLIFAAPLNGEVVNLDTCLGDYRRHSGGASAKTDSDLIAYANKEHQKMSNARAYVAELLRPPSEGAPYSNYAFPPAQLKIEVIQALSNCKQGAGFSERLRLFAEALHTASGWTPWPLEKRWSLPGWVFLACVLPRTMRDRFFTASLAQSGY
jgi:glycosyltransferase involved in cell wall biosynthesis